MYIYLKENDFEGLEVAPTRLFEDPYNKLSLANDFSKDLLKKYNLKISSMQSIWYGRSEMIFGTDEERNILLEYTKKVCDFAQSLNCKNIVFGCPKNRTIKDESQIPISMDFFKSISDYAYSKNVTIALEANPVIYGTNFLNTTLEAFNFAKKVDSKGIKINLDIGTMIYQNENVDIIYKIDDYINHVHVSEPNLELIKKRDLHLDIFNALREIKYNKFVSIEMKNSNDINLVKQALSYTKKVFR